MNINTIIGTNPIQPISTRDANAADTSTGGSGSAAFGVNISDEARALMQEMQNQITTEAAKMDSGQVPDEVVEEVYNRFFAHRGV